MEKIGGISSGGTGSSGEAEVRKGPWTMEEDLILINYIANHGDGVWNSLAKSAGLFNFFLKKITSNIYISFFIKKTYIFLLRCI